MAIKNRGLSPRQQALLKQARKNLISRTARVWSKLGRSLFGDLNGIAQAWVSRVMQTARKNVATGYLDAIPSMPRSFERGLRDGLVYALVQGYWLEHVYMKECEAAMQEKLYHVPADDAVKARLQKMTKYELELADIEWDNVGPEAALEWLKGYTPKLAGKLEDDVLKKVNNAIAEGMREGLPIQERIKAIQELSPKLESMAKTRVEAIVRTEITRADTMGRLTEMKSNPDVLGVEFSAILDGRTTVMCDHRHGLMMRLDDPRLPFNTPPLHPHCRSLLISVTTFEHPDGLLTSHEFDDAPDGIQRPEDIAAVQELLGVFDSAPSFDLIGTASQQVKEYHEINIDAIDKQTSSWGRGKQKLVGEIFKGDNLKEIREVIKNGVHTAEEAIELGGKIRELLYDEVMKQFKVMQEAKAEGIFFKDGHRDRNTDKAIDDVPNSVLIAALKKLRGVSDGKDSPKPVYDGVVADDAKALIDFAAKFFPEDWVKAALVTDRTVANPTIFKVLAIGLGERSMADTKDEPDGSLLNQISLETGSERKINAAFHELMHIFEARVKAAGEIGRQFYKLRTGNEKPESLRKLKNDNRYDADEVAKKDEFLDAYMGRVRKEPNPHNHSEILSMGIPAVLTNQFDIWNKDPQYVDLVLGTLFGAKVEAAAQPRLTYKDITVGIVPEQNENAMIRGVLVDNILFNRGEAGHSKVSITEEMMKGFYKSAGIGFTDAATKEIFGVELSDAEAKARVEALKAYTGNAHRAMWEAYDKSQRGEKLTKAEQNHLKAYNLVAEVVQVMPTYQKADKDPKELFLGVKDGEYADALKQLGDGMILNLQHVTTVTSSLDSAKEFAGKGTKQDESGKVNQAGVILHFANNGDIENFTSVMGISGKPDVLLGDLHWRVGTGSGIGKDDLYHIYLERAFPGDRAAGSGTSQSGFDMSPAANVGDMSPRAPLSAESGKAAATDYIKETKNSTNVPLGLLRQTETLTDASMAAARESMDAAAKDKRKRRAPLKVVDRGDGTYSILDGSNTHEALRELGAENVPVVIEKPYSKGVTSMKSLYAKNAEAEPEFHSLMAALHGELGGELRERTEMKSSKRAAEKVKADYGGDWSKCVDVWGGSLIFNTEAEILNALEKLKARPDVVRIKDKWSKPDETGYRDVNMNVRLSNGVIVELQLHHRGIMEIKESAPGVSNVGHFLYEFIRTNTGKDGMEPVIEQVKELSKEFYKAGLDGQYQTIDANLKASLSEMARALSNQTSAREAEILVKDLSGLTRNTFVPSSSLSPSTAQRDIALESSSRNSTAKATSSPFSKYRNIESTSNEILGNKTTGIDIATIPQSSGDVKKPSGQAGKTARPKKTPGEKTSDVAATIADAAAKMAGTVTPETKQPKRPTLKLPAQMAKEDIAEARKVRDAYKNAPEFIKNLYTKYIDNLEGVAVYDESLLYNKTVLLSQRDYDKFYKQTLTHELGHLFDIMMASEAGIKASSLDAMDSVMLSRHDKIFTGAVDAAMRLCDVNDPNTKALRDKITELIHFGKMGKNNAVSDIFCVLTRGVDEKLFGKGAKERKGGYHDDFLLEKFPGRVYSEVFAELSSLYACNDSKTIDFLGKNFPELFDGINDAYLRMTGGAGFKFEAPVSAKSRATKVVDIAATPETQTAPTATDTATPAKPKRARKTEAEKAAEKAAKEAEKARKAEEKRLAAEAKKAEREAEKARKAAEKATEKARKDAEKAEAKRLAAEKKAAEKAEKEAARAAEKAKKDAERAAKEPTPKATDTKAQEVTPAKATVIEAKATDTGEMKPSSIFETLKPTEEVIDAAERNLRWKRSEEGISKGDMYSIRVKTSEFLKDDSTRVGVRVNSKVLEEIVKSGRIKSLFETGASGGAFAPDLRSRVESKLMGYEPDTKPQDRPIYGMLFSAKKLEELSPESSEGDWYGKVVIIFKNDIKRYTTVTDGDSLDHFKDKDYAPLVAPSPMLDFKETSISAYHLKHLADSAESNAPFTLDILTAKTAEREYIEAQIHGGQATFNNVEAIVFSQDLEVDEPDYKGMKSKELKELLNRLGIKWYQAKK